MLHFHLLVATPRSRTSCCNLFSSTTLHHNFVIWPSSCLCVSLLASRRSLIWPVLCSSFCFVCFGFVVLVFCLVVWCFCHRLNFSCPSHEADSSSLSCARVLICLYLRVLCCHNSCSLTSTSVRFWSYLSCSIFSSVFVIPLLASFLTNPFSVCHVYLFNVFSAILGP